LLGCCKGDVAKIVVEKLRTVIGGDDSKKKNEGEDSYMDQVCNFS